MPWWSLSRQPAGRRRSLGQPQPPAMKQHRLSLACKQIWITVVNGGFAVQRGSQSSTQFWSQVRFTISVVHSRLYAGVLVFFVWEADYVLLTLTSMNEVPSPNARLRPRLSQTFSSKGKDSDLCQNLLLSPQIQSVGMIGTTVAWLVG